MQLLKCFKSVIFICVPVLLIVNPLGVHNVCAVAQVPHTSAVMLYSEPLAANLADAEAGSGVEPIGKYQKAYAPGKYRTIVNVYEGRVVVADCKNGEEPDYKNAKLVKGGEKTEVRGEIK